MVNSVNLKACTAGAQLSEIRAETAGGPDKVVSSEKGVSLDQAQEAAVSNSRLFEAGVSMMILDDPGQIGRVFDDYGAKLASVLTPLFADGDKACNKPDAVVFNGKPMALRDVFRSTLVSPLTSPASDQIGRKTTSGGSGEDWIRTQLSSPLMREQGGELKYADQKGGNDLLTKIKAASSFGTTIWQLLNDKTHGEKNGAALRDMLAPLGGSQSRDCIARFDEFKSRTRTERFDDAVSRMRSERPLQVDYQVDYSSAGDHGLGFGRVAVTAHDAENQPALDALLGHDPDKGQRYANINGVPRQGAPIESDPGKLPTRPFTMSRAEVENLPEAYAKLQFGDKGGFQELLKQHEFPHGTGVNRWQPYGTFATESNLRGLPSAGAQSGGTCDTLLALHTLSDEGIYNRPDIVEPATLGVAAFMNFGAYHTFAETIPIGMSVANDDDEYNPSSGTASAYGEALQKQGKLQDLPGYATAELTAPTHTNLQHDALYDRLANLVGQHAGAGIAGHVADLSEAHKGTLEALRSEHPELRETPQIQTTRLELGQIGQHV